MIEHRLNRLAEFGFALASAADVRTHFIIERDGFVALVERKGEGFGSIGSPGLVSEYGFAALVWRSEQPWFIAKGFEQPATAEQVEAIRRFSRDLETALRSD